MAVPVRCSEGRASWKKRTCRSSEVLCNMIYSSLEDGYNRMWAKNIHSFSLCISSQSQPSGVQSIEHILKEIRRRLFVEFSYCVPCKKIWFAATWPVQRLPFLHSDELAWKACFHRIGLHSCGMDQAIRRSLPWNNIFTKPSERCRVPIDILNHTGKAFREILGSEMEASSMHSTSVSENLRVLLVCTPAHMGCYDISIVTRYFKCWICLHAVL